MEEQRTDCEVCKKLIQEKHQNMMWWKIFCIIFAITTVVFSMLYFGSGAITTEETLEVYQNQIENCGDNGTVIISGEQINDSYKGTIQKTDYTPIICITVLGGIFALIVGGGIIANYIKKKD